MTKMRNASRSYSDGKKETKKKNAGTGHSACGRTVRMLLHHPLSSVIFLFYAVMTVINASAWPFLLGTLTAAGAMAVEELLTDTFAEKEGASERICEYRRKEGTRASKGT